MKFVEQCLLDSLLYFYNLKSEIKFVKKKEEKIVLSSRYININNKTQLYKVLSSCCCRVQKLPEEVSKQKKIQSDYLNVYL